MAATKKAQTKPKAGTRLVRRRGSSPEDDGIEKATLKAYRLPDVLVELATALAVFEKDLPIAERTQTGFVRQAILEKVRRSLAKVERLDPMPDSVPVLLAKAKAAGYLP